MADRLKVRALGIAIVSLLLFTLILPGWRVASVLLYLVTTLWFLWMARRRSVVGFWLLAIAHGLLGLGTLFVGNAMLVLWLLGVPLALLGYINLSNLVDWQDIF